MKYEIAAIWCLMLLYFAGEPDETWQLALNWFIMIGSGILAGLGLVS